MTAFLVNLLLMALWVASTGEFTYGNGLLGFLVGFGVLFWLRNLVGPTSYFRKLPTAIWFACLVLYEVLKANVRVAWDVVTPARFRNPGIVAVPLDARSDLEIATLANFVTLTPGSMCVDVSDDRRTMYVHEMFVESPDETRRHIKTRFERWILILMR